MHRQRLVALASLSAVVLVAAASPVAQAPASSERTHIQPGCRADPLQELHNAARTATAAPKH